MMTFGSLFAGHGGLDIGFHRAGLSCRWQVEIDEYARKVLAKHWPTVPRHDDVRTFRNNGDWDHVDIIAGGDPCQANSRAGRSIQESLGGEFIRVVDEFRPRIVVRENPTNVRSDAPWPWWRFRSGLESLGYAVLPFRLRACCFGAFHRRDRLFLLAELANPNGERLAWREAEEESRHTVQPSGRIHAEDWIAISASRGLRSRAGFFGYVERIRGIGNSVHPAVAEWVGLRIIESQTPAQRGLTGG